MTLETNLSRKPYYDDFVETSSYYRILHKPGVAVQTRELNQVQSILQDQINKFGRNIFKEGSIIEGCVITLDNKNQYVKISDSYTNSSAFTISDFEGQYVYNARGLKALIVKTLPGYVSQAPNTNTLYVKYLNSVNDEIGEQKAYDVSEVLTIVNASNSTIGTVSVPANTGKIGRAHV